MNMDFYNEMYDTAGALRPHYAAYGDWLKAIPVEAFATQRNQQNSADVGMCTQVLNQAIAVIGRVAPRKSEILYVAGKRLRDFFYDVVGTLDEEDDLDGIPYAFLPIFS